MREVRACDFCGEAAVGVFEVLPAGIAGEEPKRMVLCDACEETLSGVVDPLLNAHEADETPLVAEAEPASEPTTATGAAENHVGESDAETGDSDEGGNEDGDTTDAATDDDSDVHEAGGRPTRNRKGTPKGYSKVMRFLEGRDFPMERETAESMAAEAYEMDASTVSAAIDHAAKHGRVRVASGKLFR